MPIDPDYVDVAERLRLFYEKYPDGRITRVGEPRVMEFGDRVFVMYVAAAYRTPDDPVPCVGTAWEPFPGPTAFTRDSELMNAETSAWGRAIVAAGIPSKHVASTQEVQHRKQHYGNAPAQEQRTVRNPDAGATEGQIKFAHGLKKGRKPSELAVVLMNVGAMPADAPITADAVKDAINGMTKGQANRFIDTMKGSLPAAEHQSDVPADTTDFQAPVDPEQTDLLGTEETA